MGSLQSGQRPPSIRQLGERLLALYTVEARKRATSSITIKTHSRALITRGMGNEKNHRTGVLERCRCARLFWTSVLLKTPADRTYLPRRLYPQPPPPRNSTTNTMIRIISHILI